MTICYDPTEAREDTRAPQELLRYSQSLGNLESNTGSDFLVTPHKVALGTVNNIRPHQLQLEQWCKDGVLVQRKSGRDMLQSIPKLNEIQARMSVWCGNPILLVTDLSFGEGEVWCDGEIVDGWSVESVRGALLAWQVVRGGSVILLPHDGHILETMQQIEHLVCQAYTEPVKLVNKHQHQSLNLVDQNWLTTRRAWPKGISQTQLTNLAMHLATKLDTEPSLINALELARSPQVTDVDGWGAKSRDKVIDWVGMESIRQQLKVKLGTVSDPADLVKLQELGFDIIVDV